MKTKPIKDKLLDDFPISVPEGYEIDEQNSTKDRIILIKTTDKFPKTWDDYCSRIKGKESFYIAADTCHSSVVTDIAINEFLTKADAAAFDALSKLIKLRNCWWQLDNYKPDYSSNVNKYTIQRAKGKIVCRFSIENQVILCFRTADIRDRFYDCFKELIMRADRFL